MPTVTATSAFFGLRPVAKAFGTMLLMTATLGIGMPAFMATRSTIAKSSGSCSRLTSFAPVDHMIILSERKYWTPTNTATITPIKMIGKLTANRNRAKTP